MDLTQELVDRAYLSAERLLFSGQGQRMCLYSEAYRTYVFGTPENPTTVLNCAKYVDGTYTFERLEGR